MLIQERVQLVIKMHNLTPSSFADKIGVQRSNISHILSGRNKPSLDMLEKIVLNFHRVNAHWLITGIMPENGKRIELELDEEKLAKEEEAFEISHSKSRNLDGERQIEKIVTFYADGTFDHHYPRS